MLFKIARREEWALAQEQGVFHGASVDLEDGFIHFSLAHQVRETAERHFRGAPDLLLIRVDPAELGEALRHEPSRGGELFPHLYAPLPLTAVVAVEPLPLGEEGRHLFPDDLEGGEGEPDRPREGSP